MAVATKAVRQKPESVSERAQLLSELAQLTEGIPPDIAQAEKELTRAEKALQECEYLRLRRQCDEKARALEQARAQVEFRQQQLRAALLRSMPEAVAARRDRVRQELLRRQERIRNLGNPANVIVSNDPVAVREEQLRVAEIYRQRGERTSGLVALVRQLDDMAFTEDPQATLDAIVAQANSLDSTELE